MQCTTTIFSSPLMERKLGTTIKVLLAWLAAFKLWRALPVHCSPLQSRDSGEDAGMCETTPRSYTAHHMPSVHCELWRAAESTGVQLVVSAPRRFVPVILASTHMQRHETWLRLQWLNYSAWTYASHAQQNIQQWMSSLSYFTIHSSQAIHL